MPGKVQRARPPAWGRSAVTFLHPLSTHHQDTQTLSHLLTRGPAIVVLTRDGCPHCRSFAPVLAQTAELVRGTTLHDVPDTPVVDVNVTDMAPDDRQALLRLAGWQSPETPTVPTLLFCRPNQSPALFLNSERHLRTPRRIMEMAARVFEDPSLQTDQAIYAPAARTHMSQLADRARDERCATFFVDFEQCPPNARTMQRKWDRATDPSAVAALGLLVRSPRQLQVVDVGLRGLWNVPVPQLCDNGSAEPLLRAYAQSEALHNLPDLWQRHERQ